jgi:hypothetical protein
VNKGEGLGISEPQEIHRAVEEAFNTKDLDGLVALYETDARMVTPDGSVAVGTDEIRDQWQAILAMNVPMRVRTRFCVARWATLPSSGTTGTWSRPTLSWPPAPVRWCADRRTARGGTSSIIPSAPAT